jgi:hypothetical protein
MLGLNFPIYFVPTPIFLIGLAIIFAGVCATYFSARRRKRLQLSAGVQGLLRGTFCSVFTRFDLQHNSSDRRLEDFEARCRGDGATRPSHTCHNPQGLPQLKPPGRVARLASGGARRGARHRGQNVLPAVRQQAPVVWHKATRAASVHAVPGAADDARASG